MKLASAVHSWALLWAMLAVVMFLAPLKSVWAQSGGYERTFPQSKTAVEKVLKEMQPTSSGRLPVLAGFATSADHTLERYQRGYYESKFQVTAAPSGGSIVRVSVQVTAWYADPTNAHSGYQLLTSNGRLEADLTPAACAALRVVLDALGGKAGPEDARTQPQRDHDAVEEAWRWPEFCIMI